MRDHETLFPMVLAWTLILIAAYNVPARIEYNHYMLGISFSSSLSMFNYFLNRVMEPTGDSFKSPLRSLTNYESVVFFDAASVSKTLPSGKAFLAIATE